MIQRLDIRGLFSTFDYSIEMPPTGECMILTGPNGYGKTTILSIVEALCTLNLGYFFSIPFKKIEVFYDSHILSIESVSSDEERTEDDLIELHPTLKFTLSENKSGVPTSDSHLITLLFDQETLSRIEDDKSLFQREHTAFMIMLRSLAVKAKFIPAQRLISSVPDRSSEILRVREEVVRYLRKYHFGFLSSSQSHDEKFITRLMEDEGSISAEEYADRVNRISSTIKEAKKFDLAGNFYIPEYSESKSGILKSYIEDLEEKLSSLDIPIKALNLFYRLLDKKKFVGKSCVFSRRYGLQFLSTKDGTIIPLNALSSGEINQIIMLYEFIFNIANDSILMIDEPEISLHVVWQHEFMKDISEIAREKNLSVLVATHSPQIIGSRWRECFDLYGVSKS